MNNYVYTITSKKIFISISPTFSLNRSFPELDHYVWEYKIKIKNHQNKAINILKPHWTIFDAMGRKINCEDDITKRKSSLSPNEEYEYMQIAPLSVPMGMMHGWYDLEDENGSIFKAKSPTVSLDSPFHDFMKN